MEPGNWTSRQEAVGEPARVPSSPEELAEPWLKYQRKPESVPVDQQRRRSLLVRGIAGGVVIIALVASVILLRPHRARIAEFVGDLKKLAADEASTSDTKQPPEVATSPRKSKFRARRLRQVQVNGKLSGEDEASTLRAASASSEASTSPLSNPLLFEIQEMNNERRLVQPRSVRTVWVHWDDLSTASFPSLEFALLATPGALDRSSLQELSGGGAEQQEMPTYLPLALQNNMEGTVVLGVVIGKDGTVQNIRLLGGPPLLASAVVDAVRKLGYKPYYRNGEPVAVETQITVKFSISTK